MCEITTGVPFIPIQPHAHKPFKHVWFTCDFEMYAHVEIVHDMLVSSKLKLWFVA